MYLTEKQVRNYLETGNIFGEKKLSEEEYDRRQAERLVKTSATMLEEIKNGKGLQYVGNAIATATHYARDDSPCMIANPEAQRKIKEIIKEMEAYLP